MKEKMTAAAEALEHKVSLYKALLYAHNYSDRNVGGLFGELITIIETQLNNLGLHNEMMYLYGCYDGYCIAESLDLERSTHFLTTDLSTDFIKGCLSNYINDYML